MSKRGENIRKRKDGRWEGRYKIGVLPSGQTQYRSVYAKTYTEVKTKLLSLRGTEQQPKETRKELRFSELTKLWFSSNAIRFKGATENKYHVVLEKHILPEMGGLRLSQISSALINEFLDKKLNNGRLDGKGSLSASYVSTMRIIIGSILKYGVAEELCSPLKTPIHKPTKIKKEISVLSDEVCAVLEKNLISNLDQEAIGILLSLHTGMRIGEICALQWEDFDLEQGIVKVRHTIARIKADKSEKCKSKLILDTPKTKSSLRQIPINSFLLPLIIKFKETSNSKFVISNTKTFVSPRTFEYRFHRKFESYNIEKVNFHTLRHTFATRCISHGVDEKSLSEMLGHADVGVTLNIYVHSTIDMKRIQIEKIA